MRILAVETSSIVAGVAVMEDQRLLGELNINHKKTHSQKLMPMISELLRGLDLKPIDIDIFAASSGPGSFTGLRIGVTTVKSMAYAMNKPVIAVPTLDALAYNLPFFDKMICPILDARNNQVYTALYSWECGKLTCLSETLGIPVDELNELIKSKNRKVVFLGDGIEVHRERLHAALPNLCMFAPESVALQKASSVAQAALVMASRNELQDSFSMVPFYLRKSQAERELEKRNKG